MKALIADDERVARDILSRALYQWGFDVIVTSDGAEALACLRAADGPILAVLDWLMPHIEGPEVCRQIRNDRPGANIYLMLLTSLEGRLDIVTGLESGADDYIVKPFHPDELHARVNVGVRIIALQERLNARVTELQVALARVKTLQGLLPICSYCKRIRRADHHWQRVESYIAERSDAQFSHAICPECYVHVEEEIEERLKENRPS